MFKEKLFPSSSHDQLIDRLEELRTQLASIPASELASRTGAIFQRTEKDHGNFQLEYWGKAVEITYPEFVMVDKKRQESLSTFDQAMLAYYFRQSDGTPQSGQWISFSELPDGHFYAQAFHGYTSGPMVRSFGSDVVGFTRAARQIQGRQPRLAADLGDRAFVFPVLAQVSLLAVCWLGDEDFPHSYRVLFDSAISHHLTTDACAILGSTLSRRLINAYEEGSLG
jgi:hypothetical protein